jgi:hypothetical protein
MPELIQSDFNLQQHNIEAPLLVDEVSSTEFYIGLSKNTKEIGKANWRIKRIWKVGGVWNFGFPNGNQNFEFVWDDRDTYTYSA